MMKTIKAMEEAEELLYEACEHIGMAMEWKDEDPTLAQALKETSASLMAQSERIYSAAKEHIDRKPMDEAHKEVWSYHKMRYSDKLAKVKTKHDSYSKM